LKGGIYRSRLGEDSDRESQQFIGSLDVDAELLQYEIDSSLAHTVMLKEQGWLNQNDALNLIAALKETAKAGSNGNGAGLFCLQT